MIKSENLITIALVIVCFTGFAQNREQAFNMNERLGRGINIGNTFEAPTETEWGNPWNATYFKMISELGFKHVRVPIRWETSERGMPSQPYTITPAFLDRIQEVIDAALLHKLHIVINMHHHEALFEDPAGQKERFLSQWYQIADHFKNYPDSLLFEVLNEPHGNLTPALWNDYFSDALGEIRQTNPTRIVLMGVADYGGLGGVPKLELPNDDYIILSVHYYNPFTFTHQGAEWVDGGNDWLGTEWLDTEADRQSAASEFNYALHFSEANNIPIHVGEFGAYSKADMESRKRWTTFLARWFELNNLSWAYWEFSAGFGIYDPGSGQLRTGLVDALLHSDMPEATPVFYEPVYLSDFSDGSDSWFITQQGGAAGSLSASSNKLNIAISNGGTEAWHLQLVRNNIRLEKDKQYRISFSAHAQGDRSITFYAGKASTPWNAYSSYNGVTITPEEQTYTFTFTMSSPTDAAARLVFDLGASATGVSITNVKVEELTFAITGVSSVYTDQRTRIYPNPATTRLSIETEGYHTAELFDLTGKVSATFNIAAKENRFDITGLSPGLYVLSLTGSGRKFRTRIIKR